MLIKNYNLFETRVTLHRLFFKLGRFFFVIFGTCLGVSTGNQKLKNGDYPSEYLDIFEKIKNSAQTYLHVLWISYPLTRFLENRLFETLRKLIILRFRCGYVCGNGTQSIFERWCKHGSRNLKDSPVYQSMFQEFISPLPYQKVKQLLIPL